MLEDGKPQNTKSAPVMSEDCLMQLRVMSDNITALNNTLSEQADKGVRELREFGDRLQKSGDAILTDTKNTLQKIRDLFDGYMTLQGKLDEKDAEIKRLKGGYDAEILRRFLRRFIRVDEAARESLQDAAVSEDARKSLHLICGLFEDALDECGVEKFSPKIGEDYRKAAGRVADHPEIDPTDDASKHFIIAEVLAEGYALRLPDGGQEVIAQAKVKIFKQKKEQ